MGKEREVRNPQVGFRGRRDKTKMKDILQFHYISTIHRSKVNAKIGVIFKEKCLKC